MNNKSEKQKNKVFGVNIYNTFQILDYFGGLKMFWVNIAIL